MKRRSKQGLYKKRKTVFTVLSSKVFFFILIIILSGLIKISSDKFKEWYWARDTLIAQEEKIHQAETRRINLKNILDYLRSEGYLIRMVKEKLNLVSPGEKVIFVIPEEERNTEDQKKETGNEHFFERFIQILREIFQDN